MKLTTRLEDLADSDIVIEAATEKWEVKKQLFDTLDLVCKPGAVLASNTSSISITKLAAVTKRPEAFIGMHFMNPVPVMQLIEVIRGLATSDATFDAVMGLAKKLGKTPIPCNDFPGFVSNRVLLPMINEAIYALYEGVATVESIDGIMKLGMNHPMGPLTLADFIGLDTCLFILNVLHEGLGDPKYRPCPCSSNTWMPAGWARRAAAASTTTAGPEPGARDAPSIAGLPGRPGTGGGGAPPRDGPLPHPGDVPHVPAHPGLPARGSYAPGPGPLALGPELDRGQHLPVLRPLREQPSARYFRTHLRHPRFFRGERC